MDPKYERPTTSKWDALIAALPEPHLLQTAEWAQAKTYVGWEPFYLVWAEHQDEIHWHVNQLPANHTIRAAALVLQRNIHVGGFSAQMCILYVPKGPLLDWNDIPLRDRVITDLQRFTKSQRAIFLKIDPDVCLDTGDFEHKESDIDKTGPSLQLYLLSNGWHYSPEQIQFRNTMVIDLSASETVLLEQMKQKTRYNIRLADRKGVTIRHGTPEDYPLLYRMYAETSLRDNFTIRHEAYYHHVWNSFPPPHDVSPSQPCVQSLIAEVSGEPIAALILFIFARKAWYLYGMSRQIHREKMPNYLLQWEAIRLSKSLGCKVYDLWGAPEVMDNTDPLWGVYRFKEGLGGNRIRFLGAWDYPVKPVLYKFYTQTMPGILNIMRRHGQRKIFRSSG